jgi:hypothetical protein
VLTMKNAVFWDVTHCGSCKNRSFGGVAIANNIVFSSLILSTLTMEVFSSETSALRRATRRNSTEDGVLQACSPFIESSISINRLNNMLRPRLKFFPRHYPQLK